MKINKQLFEDVLAGKLEGTFVLRNGVTVNSNKLIYSDGSYYHAYEFKGMSYIYDCNGETPII